MVFPSEWLTSVLLKTPPGRVYSRCVKPAPYVRARRVEVVTE
jgi:hypothetical protein